MFAKRIKPSSILKR